MRNCVTLIFVKEYEHVQYFSIVRCIDKNPHFQHLRLNVVVWNKMSGRKFNINQFSGL